MEQWLRSAPGVATSLDVRSEADDRPGAELARALVLSAVEDVQALRAHCGRASDEPLVDGLRSAEQVLYTLLWLIEPG